MVRIGRWVVVGLAAVLLGALLFLLAPTRQASPPARPAVPSPAAGAPTPATATPDEALHAIIASGHPQVGPSTAPFSTSDEARVYVTSRVEGLLAAIAPEIGPHDLAESCSDDGRVCTFTGPWPADDLLMRWLKAIRDGKTSSEAMGGVKFTKFTKGTDAAGHPTLEIEARAP